MSTLRKYYRKPNAYITLPSKGILYTLNSEEKSVMEEIGVLRMTMMNQLAANNPESLINGQTVEELIKDCTTIQNVEPRKMLKCDVDALIMGIRMVSVEDVMNLELVCPKCETQQTYGVDLSRMLSEMTYHEELPYNFTLPTTGDMNLKVIPSTLESALRVDQSFFQDAKEIDAIRRSLKANYDSNKITEDEMEELQSQMKSHVDRIHEIQLNMTMNTLQLYADCIVSVTTPDGDEVDDNNEILDFVTTLTQEDHDALKSKIAEINKIGIPKNQDFQCPSCEHEFNAPVEINPTDFFANGSR